MVEDEKEVRKLAVRILEKQGYRILEASNGEDALSVCKEHQEPIHLLLTDVVMPGMSGHALAETSGSLHPKMKVLYMSGYTDNAIVHHGILGPWNELHPETLYRGRVDDKGQRSARQIDFSNFKITASRDSRNRRTERCLTYFSRKSFTLFMAQNSPHIVQTSFSK